jgi:outer membrane protein
MRFIPALFAAVAMGAGAPALAQSMQVAYINLERVMIESGPGKQQKSELDREAAEYTRELEQITERGRSIEEDLKKNALVMSEEDRRSRERELQSLQQQFERKKTQYSEDFEAHRREAIETVHRRILAMVARIAQERKIDVVINQAVWVSNAIDLTPDVMRALDAAPAPR